MLGFLVERDESFFWSYIGFFVLEIDTILTTCVLFEMIGFGEERRPLMRFCLFTKG